MTDTEDRQHDILRYRTCRGCGKQFSSIERVAVYAGRKIGHQQVEPVPPVVHEQAPPSHPRAARGPARFVAREEDFALFNICAQAKPLLLQWWNASRWSKHKGKATWTDTAWQLSLKRVAELSPRQQVELAMAGVEHGWQALKLEFLGSPVSRPPLQPISDRPTPRDPAMLAALDSWPDNAA